MVIKRKLLSGLRNFPVLIQKKLALLAKDLQETGSKQQAWLNYRLLRKNVYRCHLDHFWIACWHQENHTISVEVYYVGYSEKIRY